MYRGVAEDFARNPSSSPRLCACAFLCALFVVAERAARRMEDANGSVVCTPRRRFEQAQRRATAIAAHVDARARGASRSEEPGRDDEGMAVVALAASFARRAVADAVAAR